MTDLIYDKLYSKNNFSVFISKQSDYAFGPTSMTGEHVSWLEYAQQFRTFKKWSVFNLKASKEYLHFF